MSPRAERLKRPALFGLALLVGGMAALLAPADWPEGRGTVTLLHEGLVVLESRIDVGATVPVVLSAEDGDSRYKVELGEGVPIDALVEVSIAVERSGQPVRPDVDAIELTVDLPDGRSELIPVIRWDGEAQQLLASRRPTQDAGVVLALLGVVIVLWVTEALPLFVTSLLIPVVLVFTDVAGATDAMSPFFNPIIVLFFAGFLMAEAMRRTELDHYVSVSITAAAGRSPMTLFTAMLGLTAFLSMWMSNTAATAVLVPIALAITEPLPGEGYRKALVLGIAYAATIGGVGSAIGTPANQLAIELLDEFGNRSISFVEWFGFGLPMVVVLLPVIGLYLWRRSRIGVEVGAFRQAQQVAEAERRKLGSPTRSQITVLAVFGVVAVGWLTETFHGIHPGMVALAGAIVLFVLGKLVPDDLGRISWSSLLTFGGALTLGLFLVETGTSGYVATRLTGLAGAADIVAVFAVAAIALLLTTVASNTASAAILIPMVIPLAGVVGIDATVLVVVVAIASSIDFALVIGTPPTMIAYATRLYRAGQIFRTGIVLDLIGLVLLVFVVTRVWELLGLT